MTTLNGTVLPCALLVLVTSCAASIQEFHANPRSVCVGSPVTISWVATGSVTLDAEKKASSGSQQFVPSRDTRFTLRAQRLWSSVTAEADVAVAPHDREFGGLATCQPGDGVMLSVPLGAAQVSPTARVARVTNMNRRDVVFTKDGPPVTVTARGASDAFAGQTVTGTWTMRAPLGQGETCDAALTQVANRLTFKIDFACGG